MKKENEPTPEEIRIWTKGLQYRERFVKWHADNEGTYKNPDALESIKYLDSKDKKWWQIWKR